MEHPSLTSQEKKIVEVALVTFGRELLRAKVPAERWGEVTLALVVDLAGSILEFAERDTEKPVPLCDGERSIGWKLRHCMKSLGHEGACCFEISP